MTQQLIDFSSLGFVPAQMMQDRILALDYFSSQILREGFDYGVIPGTQKPSLYKQGAEKLLRFHEDYEAVILDKSETIDRGGNYLHFTYTFAIKDGKGRVKGICEGSASTDEPKYKYIWVSEEKLTPNGVIYDERETVLEEFVFAIDKAETSGKYGKPSAHWEKFKVAILDGSATQFEKQTNNGQSYPAWRIKSISYKILNPDVLGNENTLRKMAQKRAFVGAVLIACNASDRFTQDMEDSDIVDVSYRVIEDNKIEDKQTNLLPESEESESSYGAFATGNNYHPEENPALTPVDEVKRCETRDELRLVINSYKGLTKTDSDYKKAIDLKVEEFYKLDIVELEGKANSMKDLDQFIEFSGQERFKGVRKHPEHSKTIDALISKVAGAAREEKKQAEVIEGEAEFILEKFRNTKNMGEFAALKAQYKKEIRGYALGSEIKKLQNKKELNPTTVNGEPLDLPPQ